MSSGPPLPQTPLTHPEARAPRLMTAAELDRGDFPPMFATSAAKRMTPCTALLNLTTLSLIHISEPTRPY